MTDSFKINYERERRFLVSKPSIVSGWSWVHISQAYVFSEDGYAVRVRRIQEGIDGDGQAEAPDLDATVAVKGPRIGDEREEYETQIAPDIAAEIIRRSPHVIIKRRYQLVDTEAWDVDIFLGRHEGLAIAELEGTEIRDVRRPHWVSTEVTLDSRYNNDELALSDSKFWLEQP